MTTSDNVNSRSMPCAASSELRSLPVDPIGGIVSVVLERKHSAPKYTSGILHIHANNLVWACYTLERPWLDNQPKVSCIPAGTYTCRRFASEKHGETFEVCNVPGRAGILFHSGNSALKDTQGCILLGVGLNLTGGHAYLEASRAAMHTFRQMLSGIDEFSMEIK